MSVVKGIDLKLVSCGVCNRKLNKNITVSDGRGRPVVKITPVHIDKVWMIFKVFL